MLRPASLSVQVGCAMCQQSMQKQVLAFHEVRFKCNASFTGAATLGREGRAEGPVIGFPPSPLSSPRRLGKQWRICPAEGQAASSPPGADQGACCGP